MEGIDYTDWNADQLVAKVRALEKDLKEVNDRFRAATIPQGNIPLRKTSRSHEDNKGFDPSRYSTRKIALKFAYLGQNYNGLEYTAGNVTSQPTVEEAIWHALRKGRLIFPTDAEALAAGQITWEGCDYTKCGRTDKGVSAFGQVIGLRVRSYRPVPGRRKKISISGADLEVQTESGATVEGQVGDLETEKPFDHIKDEIPYVHVLNRLLPPDIRVLAWCSDLPDDFSARYSCRERRYRYFFTNPAFAPTFGAAGLKASRMKDQVSGSTRREGWLDIKAMQDAAKRYEGLHDFRNLCKIDSSKQLTDFRRRIFHAEIRELDPSEDSAAYITGQAFSELGLQGQINGTTSIPQSSPKVYQFILHGSAFLWHQVRHMVAILFLVGQGLETPDVVDRLMDVANCPTKPQYEMADDAPLVLWDCITPDLDSRHRNDALSWIYAGDEPAPDGTNAKDKYGPTGLTDSLWEGWRKRKIDEVLAGSLLNLAVTQGKNEDLPSQRENKPKIYLGGDSAPQKGLYVPIMKRARGEHFEVVNARYAQKKGFTPKTEDDLQELRERKRDKRHDHMEDNAG